MPLDSPEVQGAIALIRETIQHLDRAHPGSGNSLARDLQRIERGTPFERKEAFVGIGVICHPKGIGDVFVPGMSSEDWLDHVAKLRDACSEAFDILEREFAALTTEQRLEHK